MNCAFVSLESFLEHKNYALQLPDLIPCSWFLAVPFGSTAMNAKVEYVSLLAMDVRSDSKTVNRLVADGKRTKSSTQLVDHAVCSNIVCPSLGASASPSIERVSSCAVCGEVFHTTRMLRLHQRIMHDHSVPHHCPHCQSGFGHLADLNTHILSEHDSRTLVKQYPCHLCAHTSYHTATQLKRHKTFAHGISLSHRDLLWNSTK